MSNINVNNLTPLLGSGSSVSVSGSLVVKNDVTIGGHLYIGDQDNDNVKFSAEVSSSVIPNNHNVWDLGSLTKQWSSIYVDSLVTHHITASGNISASGTGVNGTGSFHHVTVNGDITASGTGSFQQGVIANQSSSFTYISMSGALKTAYHVSASKLQLTETAEIYGSASMGYISSSGDLTASGTGSFGGGIDSSTATGSFGQVTAVGDVSSSGTGSFMDVFIDDNLEVQGDVNLHGNISGSGTATASFGHISASGDISTSTAVHAVQYFTDSLIFATGDQGANVVKLGGGASVTQIHGLSIDVSGSISMSGDMTLTGDISSSGRISASSGFETDAGTTSNFGNISMSGALTLTGDVSASRVSASAGFEADSDSKSTFGHISMSGDLQIGNNTVVMSGSAGQITASGNISGGAQIFGGDYYAQGLQFATQADSQTSGVLQIGGSAPMRIKGTSVMLTGSVSMSGALSMSGANADIITEGAIYGLGQISSSAGLAGTALTLTTAGVHKASIDASGNIAAEGTVSSSGVAILTGLNIQNNGVNSLTIHGSGTISASSAITSTAFTAQTNGDTKFVVDTSGNLSSSGTLAGTALTLATNGDTYASINALGTGSFLGGIDAGSLNTISSSFGYISASADISTSGAIYGETLIVGAGNSIVNGNIKFNGGIVRPLKSITADTVLDATAGVTADAGKTIVLNKADGATVTLPAAGGTGNVYEFYVGTAITSNSYVIKVADSTDTFIGAVHMMDADDDSQTSITAKGTDDTLTLNGGTTGGVLLGDTIKFTDIATNKYVVQGNIIVPAGSNPGDPFSATV